MPPVPDIYEEIVSLRKAGGRGALVSVIARKGSVPMAEFAKMLVIEQQHQPARTVGTVGGGILEERLLGIALEVMTRDTPRTVSFDLSDQTESGLGMMCGGEAEFYVEPVSAPPEVLVLGAGHVGKALVRALEPLDFRVTVWDDRTELLTEVNLPGAHLITAPTVAQAFALAPPGLRASVVIATRSHDLDYEALRLAIATPAPYVGLLGSARKAGKMKAQLEHDGISGGDRLRCPVGLRIGAEDPAEIAVSIAADLVAFRRAAVSAK